jgi:tRNA-2-methylthio-N6-dimethylallyladenosine synthase
MFYHIITIGCQMNKADGERLAAYLESLGFKAVDKPDKADLVALVTCGVRQSAENRIDGLVKQIKHDSPKTKIILTGCLSDRPDVQKRLGEKVDVYFNITELPRLAAKLGLSADNGSTGGYLNLQAKYQSAFSAYVPIGNGCNNFCAYCVVPYARGREVYRGHEEVLAEVERLIAGGYKEIILIAQNVNSYASGQVDFADLLKMVDDLPGDFWIRFATSHPKDLSVKLIATVAESKKVCPHFHIALQSGSDAILKTMNRQYTAEHFLNLVKKIRLSIPEASITTDVIVGFPSETEEQFQRTNDLIKQIGFDQVFISRYSPRPGTASAKMADDVSAEDKKQREQILDKTLKDGLSLKNKDIIGQEAVILVDKQDEKYAYGRSADFKLIRFATQDNYLGQFVTLIISGQKFFSFTGQLKI